MKPLTWHSEHEVAVDGVIFECPVAGDYTGKTNRDRFILLKDEFGLDQYATVFANSTPKNILEFGIFQGGSPALFSLWFDVDKFVGVDICEPVAAFDEFCRTHPVGAKIRSYYGVSQTDRARIEKIAETEFGTTPIDLIIDDASHHYVESKTTFEIAFPLLRPGGTYVIEDWGWAHWQRVHTYFSGQTALSTLIMELLMLSASRPDLISEVRVFPTFAFIRKSPDAKHLPNLRLDDLYLKRDLEIVGPQHLHLDGVMRLVKMHMKQRRERRIQRTKHKIKRALRRLRLA